jgi:flavin reductase (DIM6/NTAB) family NADH-FMN oxidoreductase RutF
MPANIPFGNLDPALRYKLLVGVVVPRPIAFVTTLAGDGTVNAAPFSFFNVFSEEPPLVVLGLQSKPDNAPKDTTANIRRTGEFVINMVGEDIAAQMNLCAVDFPANVSELDKAGLTTAASTDIAAPRIAEAPVALECRQNMMISFGPHRDLLVGEVVRLHARPGIIDPGNHRTNMAAYRPVGRLAGSDYSRQDGVFSLVRESYAEWEARTKSGSDGQST